jgi:hypothetical protein
MSNEIEIILIYSFRITVTKLASDKKKRRKISQALDSLNL